VLNNFKPMCCAQVKLRRGKGKSKSHARARKSKAVGGNLRNVLRLGRWVYAQFMMAAWILVTCSVEMAQSGMAV